jgi:anionic cell wall polymer biosynthesis LytR-Cps2A-Psr (LCP) family protein
VVKAVIVATLVAAAAAGAFAAIKTGVRAVRGSSGNAAPAKPSQQTWLLVGTVEADTSGQADWLSTFSWDPTKKAGFVMYVPRSTIAEVPGFGQDTLAKAMALGKTPLAASTLANLMGIEFDHTLRISDQGIQALFEKAGGITIDVDQKLSRTGADGRSRAVFAPGTQHLDGARVAEYLGFTDPRGDEITRGVRHSTVWGALFDQYRKTGGPDALGKLFSASTDLFTTDAKSQEVQRFFSAFASVGADGVVFETLPVTSTGIDAGAQLYKPTQDAVETLVGRYLAGSRPHGAGAAGRRVEILNGNGTPGLGEGIANILVPQGFRIVLNQNANKFSYEVTQIVVYSDSKSALATAAELKKLLGVGEVLVSRQPQSIVDVTIVVGRDYLKKG